MENLFTNQLARETSPYLLQHASNPVDWHPWNQNALDLAKEKNKPILLSIGYSACHWCHVMAHESFENDDTAKIMNDLFISIKVDKEERPDLDKIYQRAHQLLTQRPGGWPLTVFLMPSDQIPFFAGTYFPNTAKHGLPDFDSILVQMSEYYYKHYQELQKQNISLMEAMASLQPKASLSHDPVTEKYLDIARNELKESTDMKNGGFGRAPKFPHPSSIERLLRHWNHTHRRDTAALEIACLTLDAMGNGGINDQIGGGFCRYSTDDYWMIPHFEKMLYDNGPLLGLYTQAWVATQIPNYKEIATNTASWVLGEMQSEQGGYYSSLDADSEGEEGKYYTWTQKELKDLLDQDELLVFGERFGMDKEANFEGKWYPHIFKSIDAVCEANDMDSITVNLHIQNAILKLFNKREKRIKPGRDEKILCSWNALMIKGMIIAGRHLEQKLYTNSAERALNFIRENLWKNNRLLATYKDRKAHLNAYLDDYAFLVDAGLELLQARWSSEDLQWIMALADVMLEQFYDEYNGGFFFTSDDHEYLIDRQKPLSDDAMPSGNGIATYALARLGRLTGEEKYLLASEETIKLAQQSIANYASAHCTMLLGLEEYLHPTDIVIVRGTVDSLAAWEKAGITQYSPRRMVFLIPEDTIELPDSIAEKKMIDNKTTAYICAGTKCDAPITDLSEFKNAMKANA